MATGFNLNRGSGVYGGFSDMIQAGENLSSQEQQQLVEEDLAVTLPSSMPSSMSTSQEISDLSDSQEITIIIIQMCAATLSLIGSSIIVFKILRTLAKQKRTTPYDRIILGLSSCDILASITYALGPFLLSRDTSQRVWAFGTDKSCQMLGFLMQLSGLWAIWFNCILSFYYLLTVRFRVKRSTLRRKYELWMHLPGIIFFPVTAATGYFAGWYGEQALTMMCWVRNGRFAELVAYIYGAIPMVVTFLSLVVNNIVIYVYVRRSLTSTPEQSTHFKASATTAASTDNDEEDEEEEENFNIGVSATSIPNASIDVGESNSATEDIFEMTEVQKRLTSETAVQGFLYVASFLLTATPVFAIQVLDGSFGFEEDDQGKIYWLLVVNAIFQPLQGFFNVFIYVKPSYSRFRASDPSQPKWAVLKRALFDPNIPKMKSVMGTTVGGGALTSASAAERKRSKVRASGSRMVMSGEIENVEEGAAGEENRAWVTLQH